MTTPTGMIVNVGELRAWLAAHAVAAEPFVDLGGDDNYCLCVADAVGAFSAAGWAVVRGVFDNYAAPTLREARALCASEGDEL